VPWIFLLQMSLVVIAATALAGFLPARRATRLVVEHEE
jgi:ABC-type antimicrobial peptide transport system permease subunit